MKGVYCKAFGPIENLEIAELPDLIPAEGELIVQVAAAGVNFPDALSCRANIR